MTKHIPLKSVATVYSGYAFREAIVSLVDGSISVLQSKDIAQDEPIIDTNGLAKVNLEIPRSNASVQKNDILLFSRATGPGNIKATVFEGEQKNLIAASSLYIIRITNQNVIPRYACLYLNSSNGQNALAQLLTGANIKNLPLAKLLEFEIPIPPLHIQQSLADLAHNIKQQEKISAKKITLKKQIISQTLKNIINK